LPEKLSTCLPYAIGTGLGYRGYSYLTVFLRLAKDAKYDPTCFDTGCTASLVDRLWLHQRLPEVETRQMVQPLRVRGIADNAHETNEYVILTLRIKGLVGEYHIVDGLQANMLISTDVMVPQKIDLLLSGKQMLIGACGVKAPVEVRPRPGTSRQFQPVHVKASVVIPPHSMAAVCIHTPP
jgi:hypothetical protein